MSNQQPSPQAIASELRRLQTNRRLKRIHTINQKEGFVDEDFIRILIPSQFKADGWTWVNSHICDAAIEAGFSEAIRQILEEERDGQSD